LTPTTFAEEALERTSLYYDDVVIDERTILVEDSLLAFAGIGKIS
jgi:hypothetical protein